MHKPLSALWVALVLVPLVAWGGETAGGRQLSLNGEAVMRKFIFDLYVVSLYLEQPTGDGQLALGTDRCKRIRLKLLRNASSAQMGGALKEGLKAGGADLRGLDGRIETLLAAIPDLRAGDTLDITYVPGVGTTFSRGEKQITLPGKDFSDALFSVWLGKDPKAAKVKAGLLGH